MLRISSRLNPAAFALTSNIGLIGGWNNANCRRTPLIFMQLRILNRRSSTLSQYSSKSLFGGTQKTRVLAAAAIEGAGELKLSSLVSSSVLSMFTYWALVLTMVA